MQGARPGRHEACEIRGAMGLEMPLALRSGLKAGSNFFKC